MRFRRFLSLLTMSLSACMPAGPTDVASRAMSPESALPPVKSFAVPRPVAPGRANADIARDFLELSFELESGRALPVFTRFEGPISVRVTGRPPSSLGPDLARLLHRLRTEAGINIAASRDGRASVTIEAVSRADIRKQLPQAACFVVPNVSSLAEYKVSRRSNRVSWAALQRRDRLAIFLPNDASPQEVRDCLHEELAQAIGPLNDLYRLPDSVFNDDNVHTVLTGFDMLVLRAYYDPSLRTGMTRAEVADRIPRILARINPAGETLARRPLSRTPRGWIEAIQSALGPGTAPAERRRSAERALQIASAMGWQDHRRAFSHYAMGRLSQSTDSRRARAEFALADRFYATSPDTSLHRAYTASQLAAHALSEGRGTEALELTRPHVATAAQHENAALLATLLLIRAEAYEISGQASEGRTVRLDSIGWARYGFGPDWAVRAKMREIAALNPFKG